MDMENKIKGQNIGEHKNDVVYQVSLLQSLMYGDYHGSVTVKELKRHGNAGLGTFNRLNGEMVMLDGEVYRAAGDGSVETVSDDETTPFAVVTFMTSDEKIPLKEIPDYSALCENLNKMTEENGINRFYMIRVDGIFRGVNVRSVYAQNEPYRRLTEVMEHDQTFFDYENIAGTLIGIYCPPYMAGLNAVGWHLHFISEDKTKGGHVLGLSIADAAMTVEAIDGFQMKLPQNGMFDLLDFTVDQSEDIKKIETK